MKAVINGIYITLTVLLIIGGTILLYKVPQWYDASKIEKEYQANQILREEVSEADVKLEMLNEQIKQFEMVKNSPYSSNLDKCGQAQAVAQMELLNHDQRAYERYKQLSWNYCP